MGQVRLAVVGAYPVVGRHLYDAGRQVPWLPTYVQTTVERESEVSSQGPKHKNADGAIRQGFAHVRIRRTAVQ